MSRSALRRRGPLERILDRVPVLIALLLVLGVIQLGAAADRSDRLTIVANGKRVSVPNPISVGEVIRRSGGRPVRGHLLAVDGAILQRDAGLPADIYTDGVQALPGDRALPGSRISWADGRHISEEMRDLITVLRPGVKGSAVGAGGVVVIRSGQDQVLRERRGLSSKRSIIVRRITDPVAREHQVGGVVRSPDKVVALTFDDGPNPRGTPFVLSILRKHKVKATFFVIGRMAAESPGLLKSVVADGHEVAYHSYRHADPRTQTRKELTEDFDQGISILNSLGVYPFWYRSPGGATSPALARELRERGMLMVLWDTDSDDWRSKSPKLLAKRIIDSVRPGSVVVLHDGGGDRHITIAALPQIIKSLRKRGYRLVTVGEMMRPDKQLAGAVGP